MFTQTTAALEEIVIRILSESPGLTALALRKHIEHSYRTCSLQGLYLTLQKLETRGVIVKSSKCFSLNLVWVFDFMELADTMYDHYVSHPEALALSPPEGKKYSWMFRSLLRMDDFRLQSRFALLQELELKRTFVWLPHLLFVLLRPQRIREIGERLRKEGRAAYCIIGSRGALDRDCMNRLDPNVFVISAARSEVDVRGDRYTEVIGPYILESRMEAILAERIDRIFREHRKLEHIPHTDLLEIVRSRARSHVTVTHAPHRARKLERQFCKFFGLTME